MNLNHRTLLCSAQNRAYTQSMADAQARERLPEWILADRLRKSLEHADVESADMAQYLEVHPNTVRNWIAGRTNPPATAVKLWAMRCGLPYEWLAHGVERGDASGSHIRALIRDQQPGYAEIGNGITAMRKALGRDQRRPSNRAQLADGNMR